MPATALPGLAFYGTRASGRRAGSADQLGGHEEGERREGKLQDTLGDVVGDADADQDPERGEDADDQGLADANIAVGILAEGADQGDDDDHQHRGRLALDLAEADEDPQRRDEKEAAPDAA